MGAIETESPSVVKGKVFSKITAANIYGNEKQAESPTAKVITVKMEILPALNWQWAALKEEKTRLEKSVLPKGLFLWRGENILSVHLLIRNYTRKGRFRQLFFIFLDFHKMRYSNKLCIHLLKIKIQYQ